MSHFYDKFKDLSPEDIDDAYIEACKYDQIEVAKYLLTSNEIPYNANPRSQSDLGFQFACLNGNLELAKFLLTSPELKSHPDICGNDNYAFTVCCNKGHLELLKYLTSSPELKKHSEPAPKGFGLACVNGNLEIIKYILTDLNSKMNIDEHRDFGLNSACLNGHTEVVKYLLSSPELDKHADVHNLYESPFRTAISLGYYDIVQFLIFEFNIEKTENIQKILLENPNEVIENLFKKREIKNRLHQELPDCEFHTPIRRNKI